MIKKILDYYNSHPKLQLFIFILGVLTIIFTAYWFTTGNTEKYKSLSKVDYEVKKETPKKTKPKKTDKDKIEKIKRIESKAASAPKKKAIPQEVQKENQKQLQEIKKKRFDSDIEKQFDFLNQF